MLLKILRIIILTILNLYFFISFSFATIEQDCSSSSFYVKNINVDLTKESINEARSQGEKKAKLIGLKRLINRLIIKKNNLKFNKIKISSLINYLKINKEANSDKRYIANFDICFNRNLVIEYFRNNRLQYAETYREPISILPIFKGPRGFVLWDEKDKWYLKWQNQIKLNDGLVKLKLAKGNFSLNRSITANILSRSDKSNISSLIKNEKTNALLLVVAEPILLTNGNIYLSTYAKYYDKNGIFENTVYRNKIPLNRPSSFYNIDENILKKEVLKMINSIENNWKKSNLIDTRIYNEVDLIIPITSVISSKLEKELLFNDKSVIVKSTNNFKDKGFIKINNEIIFYNKKSKNSFEEIKRGLFNTHQKIKYKKNIILTQKDNSIWSLVLQKLEKLPFVIEVKIISLTNSRGRIIVKFMGNKKTFFQAAYEKKMIFKDLKSEQYILIN